MQGPPRVLVAARVEAVELTERSGGRDGRAALEGLGLTCSTYTDNRLLWTTSCTFEELGRTNNFFTTGCPGSTAWPERGIAISLIQHQLLAYPAPQGWSWWRNSI